MLRSKKSYSLRIAFAILKILERNISGWNISKSPSIVKSFFSGIKKFFDRLSLLKRHPSLMLSVATILPVSQRKTGFAPSNLVKNPLQSKQLVVGLMESITSRQTGQEPYSCSTIN